MQFNRGKYFFVPLLIVAFLVLLWYYVEPWAVTFINDGPYYSTDFNGAIEDLPLHSRVELHRFGQITYVLESRLIDEENPVCSS